MLLFVGMKKAIKSNSAAVDTGQEHVEVPISVCTMARAIEEVGDGWTLLILREVLCGATRFDTMQKELGISRGVLANRLSLLVDRKILARQPIQDIGQRRQHVYLLTIKGRNIIPALLALREWAERYVPGPSSPLRLHTKKGKDIQVRLTTTQGGPVDVTDIVVSSRQ